MQTGMAKTVEEYIDSFPEDIRKLLKEMRRTIKEAAPDAEECISYQMPAYKMGHILVYFAGFKDHIGFFPTASGISAFENELSQYRRGKGSVQFPLDRPLPLDLVRKIVLFRIEEVRNKKN
jgi:uncharacterized protein YdhG (YjbR/CyaY superfamily)